MMNEKQEAAMEQALDKMVENAREIGLNYEPSAGTQVSKVWWDGEKLVAQPIPLENFYKVLEQPAQQEPVGEMRFSEIIDGLIVPVVEKNLPVGTKLYTRPAKQPTEVIDPDSRTISVYEQSAQKDRIVELIHAWQAIEETSGHLRDENDVEGRMHMSVIRSAWEQMDALVREIWDERGRP